MSGWIDTLAQGIVDRLELTAEAMTGSSEVLDFPLDVRHAVHEAVAELTPEQISELAASVQTANSQSTQAALRALRIDLTLCNATTIIRAAGEAALGIKIALAVHGPIN